MKPLEFSIKQPLFVNLLCLFIIIAGVFALSSMNRDLFPNVSYDMVLVTTVYDGATPHDMERLITIPIEKELKEVDDIDEMTSASIENFSTIALKLNPDAKNKDKIVNDIQRAVDQAEDLPTDLPDDPVVKEIKTKDMPVLEVSLAGDMSEEMLQEHAKILEEIILDMPETSAVRRTGWREREIWVEVDPDVADEYYISLGEVMDALRRRNVSSPGGKVVREEKEFLLRTTGQFETADEVKEVILRANEAGNWVKVKDIAEVSGGFEEEREINKTNGKMAINLVVVKKESADAIVLANKVKDAVAAYEKNVPGSPEISLVNDHSYYLKRRLKVLINNGTIGILLVIITLLFFLNPRVAFVTAIGIPIAFMMTFFAMMMLGITINLVSLFGLIIVLGMLVDDAIVISENVFRHFEEGMPFKEAAVIGTREVWKPVTSTVLTTIAAFLPLMFMTGIMGKFVWSIPVVVIIALLSSLLEAFFILPSHLAEVGRIPETKIADILHIHRPKKWIKKFTKLYVRILNSALNRRYILSACVIILFIGTILVAKSFLPVVLFPARGIEVFFVRAKLPVGTPLEVTEEKFKVLEEFVRTIPKTEMDDYVTQLGVIQNDPEDPFTEKASHVGQIAIYLKPAADRDRETKQIIEDMRTRSKDIKGFEELSFDEVIPGPPVGKPIAVRIRGDDLEKMDQIAGDVKNYLRNVKGVSDIKDDFEAGKGEWQVVVNELEATKAGLQVGEIATAVRNAYEGGLATKIKKADEEIDVRVRYPYNVKYKPGRLGDIDIRNSYGNLVPLDVVASFVEKPGVSAIKHLDRRRVVTVSANVDQDVTTSYAVTSKLAEYFKGFNQKYPGYTISFGGEYEETEKSMISLYKAFVLAVILIFMILATNFKSIIQPLIVMMSIPFGAMGVIWTFLIHHEPLSFLGLLGAVGLSGVVVNSAIILMDFINLRRGEGADRRTAILQAGSIRIRPVLITVTTTVVGLFPLAYGLWGSDPILMPAALALMWGLIFSTGLTLILIPCFYAIIDDIHEKLLFMRFWKTGNNEKEIEIKW